MISKGIVKNIENNKLIVQFYKDSACAHCSACSPEKKMGQTLLIDIPKERIYKVGDEIGIEVDDILLLKLSFMVYILPAIFMIVGYLVSAALGFNEKTSIAICFITLLISFAGLYFYDKKRVKDVGENFKLVD